MKFKITDTYIQCTDPTLTVADNKYTVEFEFDSAWNGLTKTARFVQNGVEYDMVLANDKCAIDDLKQGALVVGVYGNNKATIKSKLRVEASILNGQLVADPTPSVYAQLIAIIGNLDGKVTSAETAAANATASASTATAKATEAAASAANAQTAKTQTESIKAEVNATATAFNTNATTKTNEFNSNYNTKKSAVDAVATEVATLKSDVQTLKSQTETAKNDAVTAKTQAETAKTGAETAKASIESSATQIATNATNIATNTADLTNVKNDLRTLERKNKALTDLLNGQELRFDTESITGASIDVASGCVADSVLKVSGKSVVVNQLVNKDSIPSTTTVSGITFTNNGDGSITVNGTATATARFDIDYVSYEINRSYYFRGCPVGGSTSTYFLYADAGVSTYDTGNGIVKQATASKRHRAFINVASGVTCNNLVFKPQIIDLTQMFGSGSEPSLSECQKIFTADYYAYNTGTIVSSQTDSVKVRGRNYATFTDSTKTENRLNVTVKGNHIVTSGTPTAYVSICYVDFVPSSKILNIDIEGTTNNLSTQLSLLNESGNIITIIEADKSLEALEPQYDVSNYTFSKVRVVIKRFANNHETNSDFRIYLTSTEKNTITTSFPVLKSAGSVSDYIDLASARPSDNAGKSIVDVVRCVGSVDLGSLSWNYQSASNRFLADVTIDAKFVNTNTSVNAITTKFTVTSSDVAWTDRGTETNVLCFDASNKVCVYGSEYTDATAFKSAMNGVTLLYEKATPTTETIEIPTDLLSAINVEAGGQITFVDHNSSLAMPITTTNEWVVRNEEV